MLRVPTLACLACLSILGTFAGAEDFRIETNVYSGTSKVPLSQNITLFQAGYVYDYLVNQKLPHLSDRVAIFDQSHGRFVVLDPDRKVKAEVKTDEVLLFASKLQAARSTNAFKRFAVDPDFEVEFSQDGELTLSSEHMTYKLKTMPAQSPDAATQYREFSDWYARFNTMSKPGSTPPFARMAVNAELVKRGLIPTEVNLSIPTQSGISKATTLRSEHHVSWRLLPRDLERIETTATQLTTFKLIDFDQLERMSLSKR